MSAMLHTIVRSANGISFQTSNGISYLQVWCCPTASVVDDFEQQIIETDSHLQQMCITYALYDC